MPAYLFVHFVGTESEPYHEQIYFSVSQDALHWQLLNEKKPLLVSTVGEFGARDPFILRHIDGSGFTILATDLSIYHRMKKSDEKNAWIQCTNARPENPAPGSRNIVLWHSSDLRHWSDPKLTRLAPERFGCFWAPKGIWDEKRQAYLIQGACKTPEDGYQWLRLWKTYTRDFQTFTPLELYLDRTNGVTPCHAFDCSVVRQGMRYYRIYKSDGIDLESAPNPNGPWQEVPNNLRVLAPNHEGPALCRVDNGWLLMLDNLNTHGGYQVYYTEDLAGGNFTPVKGENFPGGVKYRHGSLLTITETEYRLLLDANCP